MDTEEEGSSSKKFRPESKPPIKECGTASEENQNVLSLFEKLPVEIREHVLKQLSVQDLLKCRLVNRLLYTDASSVLRTYKKCCAILKKPCKSLLKLELDLKNFKSNMINGLKMLDCSLFCLSLGIEGRDVESYFFGRLQSIPLKYLSVTSGRYTRCPMSNIKRSLIWTQRQNLEELSLGCPEDCKLVEDLTSVSNGEEVVFPRLRRVVLPKDKDFTPSPEMFHFLVSSAPNLMDIEHASAFDWDWGPHFKDVCNKFSQVSINFMVNPTGVRLQLEKLILGKPQNLRVFDFGSWCSASLAEPVIKILKDNRNTLTSLSVCPVYILQAVETFNLTFPKVEELMMDLPRSDTSVKRLLQRIDVGRRFPALHQLRVHRECYLNNPHQLTRSSGNSTVVASKAHSMTVSVGFCKSPKLGLIGLVFPFVKTMELLWSTGTFKIAAIFDAFRHIEYLTLDFTVFRVPDAYIDAILCGLSLQEADLLRRLNDRGLISLTDLKVAPIRAGLINLRNLRELTLNLRGHQTSCPVSEVSGILAFSRIPDLTVRMNADMCHWEAADRLTPHVKEVKVRNLEERM